MVRKSAQARDNERQAYGNGEEEQRRPVIVSYDAHDQAAYGGTNDVRDTGNSGGYAERHAFLFLRERRPYFGVRYGNNAAGANGLYQAAGEQDGEAIKHLRQAANKRACHEHEQATDEDRLAAADVGELADNGDACGVEQRVDVHHPNTRGVA